MPFQKPSNRGNAGSQQGEIGKKAQEASERVRNLVRDGQTISAIAAYREEHPVGLKDAKDVIDEIARQLGLR